MATVISSGTVDNIKIGDDYGFFTLINAVDGQSELYILWFLNATSGGPVALYMMLLTVAATRGLTVEISHESTSAFVQQVRLRA